MTIIGIIGKIGSGKSQAQLKYGLNYAEKREKYLVCNFNVNETEIYKYASMPSFIEKPGGKIWLELAKLKEIISKSVPKPAKAIIKIMMIIIAIMGLIKSQLITVGIILIIFMIPRKKDIKPLLPWIKSAMEKGEYEIKQIINAENLEDLMVSESIVLLDEAGVLLNSRQFAKTSKKLLADLAQSRKDGTDLIWCSQFNGQIDKQLTMLTQFFWHCESLSPWDKKMRRNKMIYRTIYMFEADNYSLWVNNPRARTNPIKTRFAYAMNTYSGTVNEADLQIFKCFDSFARLDVTKNEEGEVEEVKINEVSQETLDNFDGFFPC